MRSSSPGFLLLLAALLCAVVATSATFTATHQPWLGLNLAADGEAVRVVSIDASGPSAGKIDPGQLGVFAGVVLEPQDVVSEPNAMGAYPEVTRFYDRQDSLFGVLSRGQVTVWVPGADGMAREVVVQPAPSRPLSDISIEFWVQVLAGVIACIIGAWVWALKPSDWGARLFAISGVSMLAFTNSAAIYSTRELAMDGSLFYGLALVNMLGAATFGVAMIGLFLVYPKRLLHPRWIGVVAAVSAVWAALGVAGLLGGSANGGTLLTLVQMVLILAAIGWQAVANRKDPVGKAVLMWLGLSVAVGAGAFVFLTTIPELMGGKAPVSQGYGFGFFLVIYVGLALGLRRYRLFEMGEWAFRILFYTGGALAFLALDAALIVMLRGSKPGATGLALLAVAFLYLPLRDVLWRRTVARRKVADHELFEAVTTTAFAASAAERAERWRGLAARLFDPLETLPAEGDLAEAAVLDNGLELVLPATADVPALRLRYPWKGRGLFGPVHLKLARQLTRMMRHAEASRDAFERGAAGERSRIARDLHDDVGARLLSGLHKPDVDQTRDSVREAIADMRTIVSGLTGESLPLSSVIAQLRHETGRRVESAGIALDWPLDEAENDETPLPYRVYRNWSSAHREIVSNTIRHSGATRVSVAVTRADGALVVTLTDDGKGLAAGGRSGNGLGNVARRMAELGGDVSYPEVDRGLATRLVIPLVVRHD